MRILNVLAEGQYLDHASRSLELRFGFYESSRHVSGLVKLHFERGQGTAYTMRPILGAITAAARRDRVALFIAAFLHTSWFSLAASTIYMCFRSLLRLCTLLKMVQWSEDVIKADPFFGRSRVRFRVPPWVSNTVARDHLA